MENNQKNEDKVVCHNIHNKLFTVNVNKLTWRPSVYGILFDNNKVLLSKQWDGYDYPGGGVDIHETVEEALKREFFEETGLKVELVAPVYCDTSFFRPDQSGKYIDEYWNCPIMYFLVRRVGGELSTENFDEEEKTYAGMPEWIDIEKINQITIYKSTDNDQLIEKAQKIMKVIELS
jgi:8-oxo-dGTP diphosphatase